MKSKILFTAILSIAVTAMSFAAKPKAADVTRFIEITLAFQKIEIGEYVQVVLVQDDNLHAIKITGDPKSVENIEANITHNRLNIYAKRGVEGKKLIVYVPIKNVSAIVLANGATLKGQGILKLNDLTVTMNTDCHVALNTIGRLALNDAGNNEFVYEKYEKYRLITGEL